MLYHEVQQVIEHARALGMLIVTAESCTGGGIAAALTDVAGSSDVFMGGFVTYHNIFKEQYVNVQHSLLEQHGAVSEPVARAMSEGALLQCSKLFTDKTIASVAVTGIAGPSGGSEQKPVGTAYIAISTLCNAQEPITTACHHHVFSGNRSIIREQVTTHALHALHVTLQRIKENARP